jgi:hypothetical protein
MREPEMSERGAADEVEILEPERRPERVGPDEREGVVRLRLDIDADNLEAGAMQPHAGAARLAEEIKRERAHHRRAPFLRRILWGRW